jgi:hypothetical protein
MPADVFRVAADLVVTLHAAFALFVVLGGLLALRWRGLAWVHLPAVIWGVLIEFGGWVCPLTPLENHLRERGGVQGYEGQFIEHYVLRFLYPSNLTRGGQIVLGVFALAVNVLVYTQMARKPRDG